MDQQQIIDAAFREWGKSNYANTSLSTLAEGMGVSKTAFYRHFKNKEHLLSGMKERVIDGYRRTAENFLNRAPFASFERALETYFSIFFNYYIKHPEQFFFFLLYVARQPESAGAVYHATNASITTIFLCFFPEHRLERKNSNVLPVELGFFYTAAIFWISLLIRNMKTDNEYIDEVSHAVRFVLDGVGKRNGHTELSNNRENTAAILEGWRSRIKDWEIAAEELLPSDRIFTAIAETVAEYGIWEASIDKIASRLGMSKSSLYFYFDNRDKMISTLLEREQEQIRTLFTSRAQQLQQPYETLFCYTIVVASYLLKKPDILIAFNWLRLQGINVDVRVPNAEKLDRRYAFLYSYFNTVVHNPCGLQPLELISLFNMQVVREVMLSFRSQLSTETIYQRVSELFTCFFQGAKGVMQ